MSNIQFTTVDRIFAKVHRELKETKIDESDVIEWIGEALDFLKVPEIQDQGVAFLKVSNYEAELPKGFQMVIQIARYNKEEKDLCKDCKIPVNEEGEPDVDLSCPSGISGDDILDYLLGTLDTSYRPYFDMQWQYIDWRMESKSRNDFSILRLSNHTFFNSLVCKDNEFDYRSCRDEYTLVGTAEKKLRFSFKEGYVALSYIKSALDPESGYPLIPDHIQHISAINYYLRWKIAEIKFWNGRQGSQSQVSYNMELWLKYVKQAKNFSKMNQSLDYFQNKLEESFQMVPRHNRYYGYFGNLGKKD